MKKSLEECQKLEDVEPLQKRQKLITTNPTMNTLSLYEKILVHPKSMQSLPSLTAENIDDFVKKNDVKKTDVKVEENVSNKLTDSNVFKAIVDAFCNPEVLSKVSQILTSEFIEKKS